MLRTTGGKLCEHFYGSQRWMHISKMRQMYADRSREITQPLMVSNHSEIHAQPRNALELLYIKAYFIEAVSHTLRKFPNINARTYREYIIFRDYINIWCTTPNILIKDCDTKSVADIAYELSNKRPVLDSTIPLCRKNVDLATFTINFDCVESSQTNHLNVSFENASLGLHYDNSLIDENEAKRFLGEIKDIFDQRLLE